MTAEKDKKRKYLEYFPQKHCHLYPFIVYINGLLGVQAEATLKRLVICLMTKWKQPYSRICVYFKIRISIVLVCVTHQCIWVYRVPECRICVQRPQW